MVKVAVHADAWLGIKNQPSSTNPPVLYDHTAVVIDDIMVVYGGRVEESTVITKNDTWHWNIIDNRWEGPIITTGTTPGPRYQACSFTIDGFMVLIGGFADGMSSCWI
jgi:hypothetical protein